MKYRVLWAAACCLFLLKSFVAQDSNSAWQPQLSGTESRLRGISAVDEMVAWASGGGGVFARTIDGGKTWTAGVAVAASEGLDFRDIHAVDARTAYLLSAGEGDKSRIYKTTDGGVTWRLQFTNRHAKGFFDGFAFWDADHGIAFSDPVDGRLLIVRTDDGGNNWKELPGARMPDALSGEAGFAASGSSIAVVQPGYVWIGTGGGRTARVFRSSDRGETWSVADTPITAGAPSAGIFALHFSSETIGYAVGGDYQKETQPSINFAITSDGGKSWRAGPQLPGYRSDIAVDASAGGPVVVAVGPSGTDRLLPNATSWASLGLVGYDSLSFAERGRAGWASGANGRLARWNAAIQR